MKIKAILFCVLLLVMLLFIPKQEFSSHNAKKLTQLTYCNQHLDQAILKEVNKILTEMTLKEKVGQMFIVRVEALDKQLTLDQINSIVNYGITEINNDNLLIDEYPVGGIVLFNKNMKSDTQLTQLIEDLKELSSYPLFIAVDEEGGTVSRIANSELFDVINNGTNESIGKTNDISYASSVATYIGSYLSNIGFNLNFAPVADINSNPQNPIIGYRSFGNQSDLVSKMIISQINGFHTQNIMTTIKHYPGHGDTSSDTHTGLVSINKTYQELLDLELQPFLNTLHLTDMIMVSHITLPNISTDNLPSSLSEDIIKKQLRDSFHYQGVVITDALDMQAITDYYTCEEVITLGLNADVDIFLMPYDFQASFNTLYQMAMNDTYIENRINASVRRILYLKLKYHLF